jgi:biopolymer transport protein ExbD
MKKTKRRSRRPQSASLLITPMIDMFTVILVFLVVSYSPETSRIKKSAEIELPLAEAKLDRLPQLQIEVTEAYVMVNGERLDNTPDSKMWPALQERLDRFRESNPEKASLVIADKTTPYRMIDKAVSHLSASGFSEVYFLTQEE